MSDLGGDPHDLRTVILEGVPTAHFAAAVNYLTDVQRECQLIQVGRDQGVDTDPMVAELADGLVPDIEELGDAFEEAVARDLEDGTTQVVGQLEVGQLAMVSHLQMQLTLLHLLNRNGGLMLTTDPEVEVVLTWLWEEITAQLQGRPARAFRVSG